MPAQPDGPPPPPVVQRLRLRYAKRGRLRFLSHRDIARSFERALRRAAVPMAYSAGFNPHPRISWLGASPTGTASEAEYVELALAAECSPEAVRAALDASLPAGLDMIEAVVSRGGSLAERVDASVWSVRLPGVSLADLSAAVAVFLAAERVEVQRRTKDGYRMLDARAAVVSAACGADGASCAIIELVVRHMTPTVRPDDVLAALHAVAALQLPVPPEATRRAQGRLGEDGELADPLAPDREGPGVGEAARSGTVGV